MWKSHERFNEICMIFVIKQFETFFIAEQLGVVNPNNNHFFKFVTLPRLQEAFSHEPVKKSLKFPPTQKMEKFE